MNFEEYSEFINEQIRNYKKNQIYQIKYSNYLTIFLSPFIGFIFLFVCQIIFSFETKSFLTYVLFTVIAYAVMELIVVLIYIPGYLLFSKLSSDGKKKYIIGIVERKVEKFCPECGIFYKSFEKYCNKCGGFLRLSNEYIWVEEEAKKEEN